MLLKLLHGKMESKKASFESTYSDNLDFVSVGDKDFKRLQFQIASEDFAFHGGTYEDVYNSYLDDITCRAFVLLPSGHKYKTLVGD
jgi:hypothetical protein